MWWMSSTTSQATKAQRPESKTAPTQLIILTVVDRGGMWKNFTRVLLGAFFFSGRAGAVNPAIKLAGKGMSLLKPIFGLEAKVQAAALGTIGSVDLEEVKAELNDLSKTPCVIYTYGLSPFSTEAISLLDSIGAKYERRELGPEWFLLGPRASVMRAQLEEMTGQSSLPHVFIGGESIGGLATGTPGLVPLMESGELEAKLKKVKAL